MTPVAAEQVKGGLNSLYLLYAFRALFAGV